MFDTKKFSNRSMTLEGIPPGFGFEKIGQLRKLLSKSPLSGVTRITLQLAMALLICVFLSTTKARVLLLKHLFDAVIVASTEKKGLKY